LPLGVGVRVFDRVADAGLGREVDHAARALALEQLRHGHPVADIDARELEPRSGVQAVEARLLQREVIVGAQVVASQDPLAPFQQALGDVVADEPGRAGDEGGLTRHGRGSKTSSVVIAITARRER
jgi:hypothetical protein